VLILKVVKVVCFVTLLQVLIPKGVTKGCGEQRLNVGRSESLNVGTSLRIPPSRVFWEKRLQVAENKGSGCEKEGQEKQRGGKSLKR